MDDNVSIPMPYFILLIISIIVIILFGAYQITNNHMTTLNNVLAQLKYNIQNIFDGNFDGSWEAPPALTPDQIDDLSIGELPALRHDYRKMNDPLKYPSRRYEQYPNGFRPPIVDIANGINIPTQGYLPSFQMVGYVREDGEHANHGGRRGGDRDDGDRDGDRDGGGRGGNPDHMLKLFGRRTDTNRWEYYVMHHDDPSLKIPIDSKRNDELYNRDDVHVPGYPGRFKVQLYDYETPRYIPSL